MSETLERSDLREGYKTVQLGPREIPIPVEWDVVPFDEAIELNPKYDKPNNGPFDYLPMDAVDEEKQTIEYWTQREKDDCTTTWFKNGDTVYAKITPCTENGKIAFIDGMSTEVGSGSTEFLVFHPREGVTDERFVYYLSNFPEFRSITISLMEGSTGRQRVPSDIFKGGLDIPLPSFPEQCRIATILSKIDEQIQQTDEVIEKTKELKYGLMQDLLIEGIGHDNYEEEYLGPRRLEIPSEWQKARLEESSEIITRGKQPTYVEEGGVPVLNQSCIYWDGFHPEELKRLDEDVANGWKNKYWIKKGDVLINSTGKGTLGRALEWEKESDTHTLDSHITRVHPDETMLDPTYFRFYLESSHGQKMLYAFCVAGSTGQIELSKTDLQTMPILLPPVEEQRKISEAFHRVNNKLQDELNTQEQLQKLKRALMQDLLTGKKRVDESVDTDIEA
jgi:type I restriction enzyme S subunit